jgi:non-reducing end alpha-L-arabinofuranosidase
VGATILPAQSVTGFSKGQTITIDEGVNSETAVVSSSRARGAAITVITPLAREHAAGAQISGSGISFTTPLTRPHANGAQVYDYVPTPGAPNQYQAKNH